MLLDDELLMQKCPASGAVCEEVFMFYDQPRVIPLGGG